MSLIVTCIQLWRNNETTSVSDFRNVSNYIEKTLYKSFHQIYYNFHVEP